MAAVEEALLAYLLGQSAVASLVGSRVYPEALDQDWKTEDGTAVVYSQVSTDEEHTISNRSGLCMTRFTFTAYAATRKAANAAARAIKNSGVVAFKGTTGGVDIRGVQVESGLITDRLEKPNDGKASYIYLAEFDLKVSYLE